MTQNNLGIALRALRQRQDDLALLEASVTACRNALEEYTRERVPLEWALVQNNLGNALLELGERENSTARLNHAIIAYSNALKEYTRERAPLQWATTQTNLGISLQSLGERGAAPLASKRPSPPIATRC